MSGEHLEDYGFTCPEGGDFYVCTGNSTEFVGCCNSDPCSDGSGECLVKDLRTSSFDPERYANIPAQSCDDPRGANVWWTCRDNDPPFLGCCSSNPCEDGCPEDNLIAATLADEEDDRLVFLHPEETSAPTSSISASATASETGGPSATADSQTNDGDDGDGSQDLDTGKIAGISIGTAVAVAIIMVLVWKLGLIGKCFQKRRKTNRPFDSEKSQGEVSYHGDLPPNGFDVGAASAGVGADGYKPRDSSMSHATTAAASPQVYQTTPTSPGFPHHQSHQYHNSQSSTASHPSPYQPSPSSPPATRHQSVSSQWTHAENGMLSPPSKHSSHMTGLGVANPNLHPVSEIDGVQKEPFRVELPAEDVSRDSLQASKPTLPQTKQYAAYAPPAGVSGPPRMPPCG